MPNIYLRVTKLTSWKDKSKGLIGESRPYAVYFETRWGIHTFGVRFPITVVILGDDDRVVTLKHLLAPNRLFFWHPRYHRVVELPIDTQQKLPIRVGDHVTFL